MTNKEFSNNITLLLDSYGELAEFGKAGSERRIVLNEYEKSVFLTMAQKELVVALYDGRNFLGESFESNEELRRYLDSLVTTAECSIDNSPHTPVSENSVFFCIPEDSAYIIYEQATIIRQCKGISHEDIVDVLPVTHDEYKRLSRNPFRKSNERRVLRLDCGKLAVEIISDFPVSEYKVRYLAMPTPIILEDLTGTGVSVDGETAESECSLNPMLHDLILRRAVQLAITAKSNRAS